jgi:transketolase
MKKPSIQELKYRAAKVRRKIVRMVAASGSGHAGGALSCVDALTALYFYTMVNSAENPKLPERDRFVLSAGHKCMAQYAVLCEKGYFPESVLDTYGCLGTQLPGHPDMHKLPGIEANTGALGHGLSISVGMALGLKETGQRVFTVLGDGELPEGSNWEAIAAAGFYGLDNLIALVDLNGLQISGQTKDIMDMSPLADKFESFGWAVGMIDGNDMEEIVSILDRLPLGEGKPSAILMHTIKGKDISFGENRVGFHFWKATEDELRTAAAELDQAIAGLEGR